MTNKLGSANPNNIKKYSVKSDDEFTGDHFIIDNGKKILNPKYDEWLGIQVEKGLKKNNLWKESEGITSLLKKIPFGKIHKYNTNE